MKGVRFNEYCAVLPPHAQVYSPLKKYLSWMGLPEFVDDTVTNYTRPTPSIDVSKSVSKEQEGKMEKPLSTARPTLENAQPKMTSFVKTAHSNVKRPFEKKSAAKNKVWSPNVRPKIPTVGLKVPTAKPTVAADKGNKEKAVKASARWIWKPKQTSSSQGYWDSGCSRHMTGNISYLSKYKPFNRGYVSFGHGRGKITGKGSIKTDKLEFKNVYFVEELKYNLLSVSQIYDNKNSVLFTDTECLVLEKHFKLVDDKHVLLRTPRQ
nr:ribonuclease H-like domain-containing protein [Tanacetum cinerariifolium]